MDSNANNADINESCEESTQQTLGAVSDNVATNEHVARLVEDIATSKLEGLDEFLKRPVKIASGSWASGTRLSAILDVYNLWADNGNVRAKLRNFGLFRGTLRVRLVINASKFHYGYLMMSWIPFGSRNENYGRLAALPGVSLYTANQVNCWLSQSPDVMYMMVNDCGTIEMDIPFIYYNNYFRFQPPTTNGIILKTDELFTDEEGWEMGELYLRSFSNLGNAGTDSQPVEYTVMAWMKECSMFPPTTADMKIESGGQGEFEANGPISSVASAVARAAGKISTAPIVGPWALATSKLSEGIARFSALFGFSRPLIVENAKFVKEYAYANEAVCNGTDTCYTLALDIKREMTQDQGIVGDSTDPLDIAMICARESWIDSYAWSASSTQGDVIFSTPLMGLYGYLADHSTSGQPSEGWMTVQLTPGAFALSNFQYYRCTVVFRLVCVASGFHRGRLFIAYEPSPHMGAIAASNTASLDMNNQMGFIWDLQTQNEIEVRVPFCSDVSFLENNQEQPVPMAQGQFGVQTYQSFIGGPQSSNCFGYLTARVLNTLMSNGGASVFVEQFVHLEDVEVMRPFPNASAVAAMAPESEGGSDSMSCCHILGVNRDDDNIALYHGGESVKSLRSLLKRYSGSVVAASPGTMNAFDIYMQRLKVPFNDTGAFNGVPPSVKGKDQVNYYSTSFIDYFRVCFVGHRGGMRYKVFTVQDTNSRLRATRVRQAIAMPPTITMNNMSNTDSLNLLAFGGAQRPANIDAPGMGAPGVGGVMFMSDESLAGIEVEAPYYTKRLFDCCNPNFQDYDGTAIDGYQNGLDMTFLSVQENAASETYTPTKGVKYVIISKAIAEDFTFLRFQSAPLLWVNTVLS